MNFWAFIQKILMLNSRNGKTNWDRKTTDNDSLRLLLPDDSIKFSSVDEEHR